MAIYFCEVLTCYVATKILYCGSLLLSLNQQFIVYNRNGPSQRASALVVVSGLLYSGSVCNKHLTGKDVKLLVDCLRKEEIRCCDHTGVRMQLATVTANLINLAGDLV